MDFYGGEELPRRLFNSEWKHRESALRAMEKVCLQNEDPEQYDQILINLIKPVVLGTQDKVQYVVHTALDMCANVLHLRLGEMKQFGGSREMLDDLLEKLFENIVQKSGDPKLKTSIFRLTARIVAHPVIG